MQIIQVVDLWKSYGKHEVIKGLNLSVEEGETVVILGRSGVGKSVLLRLLFGIEAPDKGYILINGKKISDMPSWERYQVTQTMGMLFQGSALFDSMDVGENVAFYLRQHEKISEQEIKHRVEEALKKVGLAGAQHKMPAELSGGMRKRAALARLIVYHPCIVLYDEPTTGLDPITSMQIVNMISKTQKHLNSTAIIVTHDVKAALTLGSRIAFHEDGKIVHCESPEQFLKIQDPNLQQFIQNSMI